MAKLNQIIAIEKGIKSRVYSDITELDKVAQKPELFNGFQKTYQPKDDDGEKLPDERKKVQFRVPDILNQVARLSTEWYDVTARKDWTNCTAKADVVVEGQTLLQDVPISHLLFLEKQLTDLRTMIGRLPVLDEGETWTKDTNSDLFKTPDIETHRTRKVQRPIVLYPHSVEHPAQTAMITEDVIAGFWKQVKHSGALPKPKKDELTDRIEKLLQAVKQAREAANGIDEVTTPKVGDAIFNYLMED